MQITKFTDFINFAEFATRKKKFEIKKGYITFYLVTISSNM